MLLATAPPAAKGQNAEDLSNLIIYAKARSELDNNTPIADMIVNGQKVPCAIDTGFGSYFAITRQVAEQLNLEVEEIEGQSTGQTKVRLATTTPGVETPPVNAWVVQAPEEPDFGGVLGWQLASELRWLLYYPENRQAILSSVPDTVKEHWQSFALRDSEYGAALMEVEHEGKTLSIYLDTGHTEGMLLGKELWDQWQREHPDAWTTLAAGYSPANKDGFHSGLVAIDEDFKLGDLSLGTITVGQTFANVLVNGQEVEVDYHLGVGAFRNRPVLIDGPGRRIYFGPKVEPNDALYKINRAQAVFLPESLEPGPQYAHVIKGGVAYRAGLRDRDKIIRVNGEDARNWQNNTRVRPGTVFNVEPGTTVQLEVERDNEIKKVSITLEPCPFDP